MEQLLKGIARLNLRSLWFWGPLLGGAAVLMLALWFYQQLQGRSPLEFIVTWFGKLGYYAILFGVMAENAGLPVPGETIVLAGGWWAHLGHFEIVHVIAIASLGAVIGDNIGFSIGRYGGRRFVTRYGRYFLLNPKRLAHAEHYFHRHGGKTVFMARFIFGLRVVGAWVAGLAHMSWPKFLFYNAAGAVAWATTMTLLGFYFGKSWDLLERWIGRTGLIVLLIVVGLVLFMGLKAYTRQRRAA